MKKYLIYLFTLASTLLIGCDSFRDMSGTAEVNPITVDVYLDITVENISTLKDLTVKFDNYDEDLQYPVQRSIQKTMNTTSMAIL